MKGFLEPLEPPDTLNQSNTQDPLHLTNHEAMDSEDNHSINICSHPISLHSS